MISNTKRKTVAKIMLIATAQLSKETNQSYTQRMDDSYFLCKYQENKSENNFKLYMFYQLAYKNSFTLNNGAIYLQKIFITINNRIIYYDLKYEK